MNHSITPVSVIRVFCSFYLLFACVLPLKAQDHIDKCGTVPFNDKLKQMLGNNPGTEKNQFEQWINAKKKEGISKQLRTLTENQQNAVLRIPVVVHVIHRGEAVGEGTNIPMEQIESQIQTLNEDFRRQNADQTFTPLRFQDVAADVEVEFVLALQSPDGFATDGVTRTEGNQLTYGINSASTLSSLSYWPAEDYLNIWVAPLRNGYLGFAQFPESDLQGLEDASTNRLTDGVVVDYRYFGSGGNANSSSYGRTATHEVGHFLGLRHIWGDGDCSADDFVDDTPLQSSETNGCPIEPSSCGSYDMFQNYMDYTDDACMNLFTEGQKERIWIVLLNSPRRVSLLESPGLEAPVMADNDAAIVRIISPQARECEYELIPAIEVVNAGTETINSVSIQLFLQGNLIYEQQSNITLASSESAEVSFPTLNLQESSSQYEISFSVSQVNGGEDENNFNDTRSVNFIIPQRGDLPLADNFEAPASSTLLNSGTINNPDQSYTWEVVEVPGFDGEDNTALSLQFFEYETGLGEKDYLYTPVYNLSGLKSAELSFLYAYAAYEQDGDLRNDGFTVAISTDCGATISEVLFDASGEDLSTSPAINSDFTPASRAEWEKLSFSLDAYLGEENVQFIFIGTNDYGNNLYLDNINLEAEEDLALDLAIDKVFKPSLLSANTSPIPTIRVVNEGSSTVNRFEVNYSIDGGTTTNFVYDAFPLEPGQSREFTFEEQDLTVGIHRLNVSVSDPNLTPDEQTEDNERIYNFYVDDKTDILPLIQDFSNISDGGLPDVLMSETSVHENAWQVVNPDGDITWNLIAPNENEINSISAYINLYQNQNVGSEDMLVSPILDFSTLSEASVFFKISYALLSAEYADTLRVKVSTDLGDSYTTVYEKAGEDLAVTTSQQAWAPAQESDWKQEFINLTEFAGEENVRLAFEVSNAYGNNLYLDDIEFFVSATQEPVAQILEENNYRVFPNPYTARTSVESDGLLKIAFNLRERDQVNIFLIDTQGKLVSELNFPNTLNQTYQLDLQALPTGMYIVKVVSSTINSTNKLLKQ